jgi:hypothetical protein
MMKIVSMALILVAATFGGLSAQDEEEVGFGGGGDCGNAYGGGCGWGSAGHKTEALNDGDDVGTGGSGVHDVCKVCVNSGQYAPYELCHPSCTGFVPDLAYSAAMEAARRGDVLALLWLAPYAPNHVSYNFIRHSLQVRACSGAIVANIPVRHSAYAFMDPVSIVVARSDMADVFAPMNWIAASGVLMTD